MKNVEKGKKKRAKKGHASKSLFRIGTIDITKIYFVTNLFSPKLLLYQKLV